MDTFKPKSGKSEISAIYRPVLTFDLIRRVNNMIFNGQSHDELAGDHMAGTAREAEEERRKNEFFGAFRPDSNTSNTRYQENHGDRNK